MNMGDRFYRQRDNLTMNLQPIPPSQRRPKGTVPTYYQLLGVQKSNQNIKQKPLRQQSLF